MAKVQNPVGERFSIALRQHSSHRAKLMEAATSGLKSDLSVVDAILGAKVKSAADMAKKVINNMGSGFNVSNIIISSLENFRERFENIKRDISILNNADPETLIDAQLNYDNDVANIEEMLNSFNFGGKKLFDGTLATQGTAAIVAAESMPAVYGPYKVQSNISSASNILFSVPKLLPGDGSVPDVAVPGRFQPLFPVTIAQAAANNANTKLTTAIADQAAHAAVFTGAQPDAGAVTGLFPGGANIYDQLDQDVEQAVVNDGIDYPGADANNGHITTVVTNLQQVVTSTGAILVGPLQSANSGVTNLQINTAVAAVNALIVAGASVGATRTAAQGIGVPAPGGANASLIAVYAALNGAVNRAATGSIAVAAAKLADNTNTIDGMGGGPVPGELAVANALETSILNTIVPIVNFAAGARSNASLIAGNIYGDVKTDAGRTAIIQGMDAKITTLDSIIARITGAENSLTESKKNLEISMLGLYDAGDNYLSANYEEVIERLVLLLREDKVASLIFALSERAINAILNQLESAAAAA